MRPPPPPAGPDHAATPLTTPKADWPALPERVKLGVVRFSYNGWERCEVGQWLATAVHALNGHPRVLSVHPAFLTGYPIDRLRNKACVMALDAGLDFLVMVDNDMAPDLEVGFKDYAEPFLPAALDFALAHAGPCLVGAPYCAQPPGKRVLVNRWADAGDESPDGLPWVYELITRHEAAGLRGIRRVAALPTGLLLIDTRALAATRPPWFYYEWKDAQHTELASTEDTVFTRDLEYCGVPSYAAWSSFAGHIKEVTVPRPNAYGRDDLPRGVRLAWERDLQRNHGGKLPVPKLDGVDARTPCEDDGEDAKESLAPTETSAHDGGSMHPVQAGETG